MLVRGLYMISLVTLVIVIIHAEEDREADHDEARLHKDIFLSYDSNYRPVKDHKDAVIVKVRLSVKYLSFDSLEETLTVHTWVAFAWKDYFLSWTPSDYGGITELQVESHNIWTPQMALFNADASLYVSDNIYTTCSLANDGSVTCVPPMAYSGICRTAIKKWPYDSQNCSFYFGAWMHSGEQVNFTFYNNQPIVLDDFQNGPGWKLLTVVNKRTSGKYSCCPNSSYPMLHYTFVLDREAVGLAATIIIPSVLIIILTLTSLLMDIKDNTRLFLSCFSFFGHITFLSEIGYAIPKHSADTPIILLFVRDSMIITLLSILLTLLLMWMRSRASLPPTWVVSVSRLASRGPGRYVVFTEFDSNAILERKELAEELTDTTEQHSKASEEWILFANLLNSFVFIIVVLIYFVLIVTYIPTSK